MTYFVNTNTLISCNFQLLITYNFILATSSRGPALLKQGAAFFESSIPSVPGRSFVSPQHSLSRGEDEDKYKRKSVLELIHRSVNVTTVYVKCVLW